MTPAQQMLFMDESVPVSSRGDSAGAQMQAGAAAPFDFNASLEGDLWANMDAQGDVGAALGSGDFLNGAGAEDAFFADPQLQQQQPQQIPMPPQHQQMQHAHQPPQRQHPGAPPAHLFASAYSPFLQASFEVDGDQNGVNPSVGGGMGYSQPVRGQTGDSIASMGASPLYVGQLQPTAAQMMPMQGAYDSLIDAQESEAAGTGGSRKRARGNVAAPAPPQQQAAQYYPQPVLHTVVAPRRSAVAARQAMQAEEDDDELGAMDLSASSFPLAVARGSAGSTHSGESPQPEEQKKVKHQLTDRQRRAKIKESMDALKALVPLEPNQKADQATIVQQSVTLVKGLQDEVAQLRQKLAAMEVNSHAEQAKLDSRRHNIRGVLHSGGQPQIPLLSNSPFTSMMASLNGAGVSMWRVSLAGKIIEVNLVFELVSGFSAAEVVGNSPCGPPLFGSLSIMPAAFLKAFSQVSTVPQVNAAGEPLEQYNNPNNPNPHQPAARSSQASPSSGSTSSPHPLEFPSSPASHSSPGSNQTAEQGSSCPPTPDFGVNPLSTAQSAQSQASVAPLYANASISSFPVVAQAELQNFFPAKYNCMSLINARDQRNGDVMQPQPHASFLTAHLAALPPNHVLKLLSRYHTLWGEVLESIVTMCLVRDAAGEPDYIMLLSTPSDCVAADCRRLLTPATHTASVNMPTPTHDSRDLHMKSDLSEAGRYQTAV